jgi:4-amino-4-deoxy-L-arabinose transferase-like glycosyltransferase
MGRTREFARKGRSAAREREQKASVQASVASESGPPWPAGRALAVLGGLTVACLAPFSGRALNVDEPLFIWAARRIAAHPWDPYGFAVNWYSIVMPMPAVTQNPPLASYLSAGAGALAGWSEAALHLAFLGPALAIILGTYLLARRFTRHPVIAAAVTLFSPGFLASSATVMSDGLMLALWITAVILWMEGMDRDSPALLTSAGLCIALSALAKYYGAALIPLLLAYTLARQRRRAGALFYLLIPAGALAVYHVVTSRMYGHSLLLAAAEYALNVNSAQRVVRTLTGLSFAGGCALPVLAFMPLLWSRRAAAIGAALACAGALYCAVALDGAYPRAEPRWTAVSLQFGVFAAAGVFLLALAVSDWRRNRRDPAALLLLLWTAGTFVFAGMVNWSVNARSVLPLLPAVGITLARRIDRAGWPSGRSLAIRAGLPLALAGAASLWVTAADARLANSAREAAAYMREKSGFTPADLMFEGHWGFQYYMQEAGYRPIDFRTFAESPSTHIVIPRNNTNMQPAPPEAIASTKTVAFDVSSGVATMSPDMGAGFYSDVWGPLPFAFGPVPEERYAIIALRGEEP